MLGTPTREEISAMNSNYTEFKFPQIKACQWRKVFRSKTPDEAMDFISRTLAYAPERRVKPLEGCAHSFFDELRDEKTRLPPLGKPLPPLFDFTSHELNSRPEVLDKLIPLHLKNKFQRGGGQNGNGVASGISGNNSGVSGKSSNSSSVTGGVSGRAGHGGSSGGGKKIAHP